MENPDNIILYGTKWCPDSLRANLILKKNNIVYTNVDIDNNPEATKIVIEINNGNRSVPTILFPDGTVLVEPTSRQLKDKLNELELV